MREKIPTNGGQALVDNPFASLKSDLFPPAPVPPATPRASAPEKPARRGIVHLRIERSGRGGKTVTILFGPGIERLSEAECGALLRALKAALGTGGTAGAPGTLEVQGDERPRAAEWLSKAGFKPHIA
ncbi:MAG: hypothetical protein LBV54_00125 [Puniceicoccales bacterium]|jgi:translation initiation factor 1 (eIF-1/SUI1)|nr:hypothetical protein [Puniceicoccales bacterium]